MTHLLLLLVLITCLGITGAWIAENPGNVTIHWYDYQIDTSFAFLLLIAALVAFLMAYVYIIVRGILTAPKRFAGQRTLKQYHTGLTELTYSVAALAAADVKSAEEHTRKAEKLLGKTPITLLLSAQIARSQGDDGKTRVLLEQMLEHKETEYLAARSLSDVASKQQHFPRALSLAQRAHSINPKQKSAVTSVISLHTRLGQWQEALHAIEKAMRKGHLLRSERRHHRGVVHLEQGLHALADGQVEAARNIALRVMKELPDFAPAVQFAADAFMANHQSEKATRIILHAWKKTPNAQLADTLRSISDELPKDKQMKLMRKLIAINPESAESSLAVAQTAIQHKEWDIARNALKTALAKKESARACKMMAEIEQTDGDIDEAQRWLGRVALAEADPTWTCSACGSAADKWAAHCTSCGGFDTLEWKQREFKFAAA